MGKVERVTIIVLDSVGAGELPDANLFDDCGSNTLGNMAKAYGGMSLPNMGKWSFQWYSCNFPVASRRIFSM